MDWTEPELSSFRDQAMTQNTIQFDISKQEGKSIQIFGVALRKPTLNLPVILNKPLQNKQLMERALNQKFYKKKRKI